MSGARTQQDEWLKQTLGFDVAAAMAGKQNRKSTAPANGAAEHDGGEAESEQDAEGPLQKWPFSRKKKQGAGKSEDTEPPLELPKDKALAAKLKALTKELSALKKRGFDTSRMEADGADLGNSGAKAEKLTDATARTKAMDGVKARLDEAIEHAQTLAKAAGDPKGKKDKLTDEEKSAIYEKAIKDQFDIEITIPPGFTNTHFDKVFDMLGTVPKDHVKQLDLKKLIYSADPNDAGGGSYWHAEVEMGDFGDAKGEEVYEIDGKKLPANSFNVTTLHEVGHAVDTKEKIMVNHRSKPGCGGWTKETIDTVTDAFLKECKKAVRVGDKVTDDILTQAINSTLDTGTIMQQPDGVPDDDWQKVVKFLADNCVKVRDAAQPYFKSTPVVTGDKVYTESSKGYWWSYASSARASTKVNNYQWRSPPEWFAEIYAITWLKKKKPPTGVDAAAAEFCWKG
jgi:hypothetical protein